MEHTTRDSSCRRWRFSVDVDGDGVSRMANDKPTRKERAPAMGGRLGVEAAGPYGGQGDNLLGFRCAMMIKGRNQDVVSDGRSVVRSSVKDQEARQDETGTRTHFQVAGYEQTTTVTASMKGRQWTATLEEVDV